MLSAEETAWYEEANKRGLLKPDESAWFNEAKKRGLVHGSNKYKPDQTEGMGMFEKLAAGAGKAVVDMGRGIHQMAEESEQRRSETEKKLWGRELNPERNAQLKQESAVRLKDLQSNIDESRKLDAPLMKTGAGITGNVAGNILASIPAAFVPGANTAVGSAAVGSMLGAFQPTSGNESRLFNMAAGGALSLAGHGLGKGINKAVKSASNKVSSIERNVAEKAAADAAADTASARSAAGTTAQDAYRQLEHLRELGSLRSLTPDEAQVAALLEKELAGKAMEKLVPSVARKEAAALAYKEAMETESKRAAEIAASRLGGGEVKNQIMARVKRYGPAVAGGLVGNMIFPGLGGSVGGAATGLVLRPAIRSVANLSKNPAVQHKLLSPIAKVPELTPKQQALIKALMMSSIPSVNASQE